MSDKVLFDMGKWIAEFDENGNCTKAVYDDAYLRLLGLESEGDMTDSQNAWKADVHPDDVARIDDNAIDLFSKHPEGMDYDLEYRMMTKSGYHWFHDFAHCTRRTDGSISRMDGVIFDIQDIVDKTDAQKALAENNSCILALEDNFESLYDIDMERGIYTTYVKGYFTKQRVNSKLTETKDFFVDVHKIIDLYVYPEDREGLYAILTREAIRANLSGQEHFDYYYRVMDDDGLLWFKLRMVNKDSAKKHIIIGIFNAENDVEAKQIAAQKVQLEEALSMAQSANRAKTIFLNNMSHDIRTPMNAIIGYTNLATKHIDNRKQVQDYLAKISQSSEHLLSLINDVLDMSRIESGKVTLNEQPEKLSEMIHTLQGIIEHDVHAKKLDFFVNAIDIKHEDIICDKLRLNQIFLNILSNAIKYTASGGCVVMCVTEKTNSPDGSATFEFRINDTGIGMDKEFLNTIFEPFTRVKSSTVSGIQGTGLGMAITKHLIDMMGGHIDIDSEPGMGTEVTVDFTFRLQDASCKPDVIPELNGVRALVVHDDPAVCKTVCAMGNVLGMCCEWCTSRMEAVSRTEVASHEGEAFKVIIMNWNISDGYALDTVRKIKNSMKDDGFIILSIFNITDIEIAARLAGVTAFVSNPIFLSDLQRTLNDCLGRMNHQDEKLENRLDFSGRKALLVEDNELNREIAAEVLREEGLVVEETKDGSQAVARLREKGPDYYDFILMDIQMPVMNGYEATKAIRDMYPNARIPIIALSANAFEEDRKASREAGMDDHVAKPIKINELFSSLTKFM